MSLLPRIVRSGMGCIVLAFTLISGFGQAPQPLVRTVPDPGIVTTRQTIAPAGVEAVLPGRVHAVAFCGGNKQVTVAVQESRASSVYWLSISSNQILARRSLREAWLGIQGMACVPGSEDVLLSLTTYADHKEGQVLEWVSKPASPAPPNSDHSAEADNTLPPASKFGGNLATGAIGGIGVSGNGQVAVAALTGADEVAVLDLTQKSITQHIHVGIAPFTAAVNGDGTIAWVSNWGGRVPGKNARTAPTGAKAGADQVLIDAHGIASSGTVSRVDLRTNRVTDEVGVGLHPTALAWDEARKRLYVANGNSDSVSVIGTDSNAVIATWKIQPFTRPVPGVAPTALALSPDGKNLYVSCGGINAVAVINTADGAVAGLIPTGWYPSYVAASPDGLTLAVSTLLGVGSGTEINDETLKYFREELPNIQPGISRRYVHSYRGTVHLVAVPERAQLAFYTRAVAENNHLRFGLLAHEATQDSSVRAAPLPVPEHAGNPSLIEHVIYIVKENRTYDQLFGDLDRGNGDPSLVIYGQDVTPNHHKLAREFVVLDNFYATGGNSGDGHQWVTQAAETDYAYWPGYGGRSYPFDGNDPIAYARGGFLWDAALKSGKTFADFGEFVPMEQYAGAEDPKYDMAKVRAGLMQQWKAGEQFLNTFHIKSPIPPLDAHLVRDFPSYGGTSPDVVRARIFLRHLHEWEQADSMPNLVYLQLPADHTGGTMPGWCTPKACLADNDLALGQIVEGVSRSRFWSKTAIFVVEDDAQGGVDHVDGHRTVALAISPYIRRGSVDSTFYSHPSIAKTIELMLGLPNLSLFDLIANDMRNAFQATPDLTPYVAEVPSQSIFERNPPLQSLKGAARNAALASLKMNFKVPDAAPADELNRILWHEVKGWSVPYPKPRLAVFSPYASQEE